MQALAQQPATVFAGRKVVEVRPQNVDKASATRELIEASGKAAVAVAIGDDRSDEELFRTLGANAYTFCAGPGPTHARFRLDGPAQVRALLREFMEARRA